MIERVTNRYEHMLQSVYWEIGNRGIRVAPIQIDKASSYVDAEIRRNLAICSNQWGCIVFLGAENAPKEPGELFLDEDTGEEEEVDPADLIGPGGSAVNINSTKGKYALLKKLQDLGYNVPKITKKDGDGNYDSNYSTGELAVQKMLSENQFGYDGGDPALRAILAIRGLSKLKTSYLNARLYRVGDTWYFLSSYNVAGTLSGRRSSRRHTFGFGNNAQNFPKHQTTAGMFRRCLVSRPGNIFLMVDQVQAEDWPVSALAMNYSALTDLRAGIDRHSQLATMIWGHRVPPKNAPDWNDALYDIERYIGKKGRHANNYGMTAPRFKDVLIQETEGRIVATEAGCRDILRKIDLADPNVKGVYHKYVQETLSKTRVLITPEPFLRERQFLGLRPKDANTNILKEAYAFIPQSTVGDNTGCAVLQLETTTPPEHRNIVQEGHDSIVRDVVDSDENIYQRIMENEKAFDRKIRFANGIEIQIPIEGEVGYDFETTVKIKEFSLKGVREATEKLRDRVKQSNVVQVAVGNLNA